MVLTTSVSQVSFWFVHGCSGDEVLDASFLASFDDCFGLKDLQAREGNGIEKGGLTALGSFEDIFEVLAFSLEESDFRVT